MTQTLPTVLIIIFVFGAIAFIVGVLRRKAHSNSQINTFSDVTIKDLKDGDVLVPEGTSYVTVSTADWKEVKSISPLTDITTNSPYYSGRADINPEFADTVTLKCDINTRITTSSFVDNRYLDCIYTYESVPQWCVGRTFMNLQKETFVVVEAGCIPENKGHYIKIEGHIRSHTYYWLVNEAPVEEMPKKDPRIHELTEKIGNYQKQLAYWKGDVLKEVEYRGLINDCLRSIDKIRRESNNG